MKTCCRCKQSHSFSNFTRKSSTKDGLRKECKDCVRKDSQKFQANNPNHNKEAGLARRKANPQWYKDYRENNKERIAQQRLEYREQNPTAYADWCKAHPDKTAEYANRYRTKLLANTVNHFTAQEWLDLCEKYDNKCLACKRTDVKLTVDHVIPISKLGSNSIDNIQPLCQPCNSRKSARIIDYRE
jgi:5-methylcytosine-specific restriction endonuclease McrA